MNRGHGQHGMTLIGWLLTLAILGFAGLFGLRLVPIYMESFKVDAALQSLIHEGGVLDSSRNELARKFAARMSIEDVDRFDTEAKLQGHFFVEKQEGRVVIRVQYEAVAPLLSNLSIVADWDKEVSYP